MASTAASAAAAAKGAGGARQWGSRERSVANVCAFVSSQYVQICQTNEIATGPHHSAALRPGSICTNCINSIKMYK